MNRNLKKCLSLFLAMLMVLTCMPVVSLAAETASGTCGDNATWEFDGETLTISGTGTMYDYGRNLPPWQNYNTLIKTVIIENGITSIGNNAFQSCSNISEIIIPNTVTKIGTHPFRNCTNLTSITIPESVAQIDLEIFMNGYINTVTFLKKGVLINSPSSITGALQTIYAYCCEPESIGNAHTAFYYHEYHYGVPKVISLGHMDEWNEWITIDGLRYRKCSGCKTIETEIIDTNNLPIFEISTTNDSFYAKYQTGFYSDINATTPITKIDIPTKENYEFGGYYTEANGNGTQIIDQNGNILVENTYFLENTTIYPKWTLTKPFIICEDEDITLVVGDTYTIPASFVSPTTTAQNLYYQVTKRSSKENVDVHYADGIVKANDPGTATIEITLRDKNWSTNDLTEEEKALKHVIEVTVIAPVKNVTLIGSKYNFNFVYDEEKGLVVAHDENGNIFDVSKFSLKAGDVYYCYPDPEYPDEYILFTCTDEKLPDEFAEYFNFTGPYLKCDMGIYAGVIDNQLVIPFLEEDIPLTLVQAYPEKIAVNSTTYTFVYDENIKNAYVAKDENGNYITSNDISFETGKEYNIVIPDYGNYTAIYTNEEIDEDYFDTYKHTFDNGYWLKCCDSMYDDYRILGFENNILIWPKSSYAGNSYDITIGEYVENTINLEKGEIIPLNLGTTPADADYDKDSIVFTVENKDITKEEPIAIVTETIENGEKTYTLEATGAGEATLTISLINADGSTFTYSINLSIYAFVESISPADPNVVLKTKDTHEIKINLNPVDAICPEFVYSSSDESVATINEYGVITAINVGTTTITIADASNSAISTTMTVTVSVPVTEFDVTVDTDEIVEGKTTTITTNLPSNTIANDVTVSYETLTPKYATVDGNGVITAVAPGEAVIKVTVTDAFGNVVNKMITLTVIAAYVPVEDIELTVNGTINHIGNKLTITANVTNDATNPTITYTVTGNSIKVVDLGNGVYEVEATEIGNATIEFTADNKIVTYEVEVKPVPVNDINVTSNGKLIYVGGTIELIVTVNSDATDKALTYTASSNLSVAEENGKYIVTADAEGPATITFVATDYSKTFDLGNIKPVPKTDVEVTINGNTTVVDKNTAVDVKIGDSGTLFSIPDITGSYAVEYETSDESVVTIDENGNLVATGKGTATVTAKVTLEDGTVITKEIVVNSADPDEGKLFCSFCDDYEKMKDSPVGFIYAIVHFFIHFVQTIKFAT